MSDYTKSTDFASKDSLPSGNAGKIVKGTEIDTEFNNIATAIATKADTAGPTFTGSPSLPTGTTGVTQTYGDSSTKLATTAFVQAALVALYPVGSVYVNATNSTNPATLFGFGTWVAFGAGRVMVGFDTTNPAFDTAGETGGSADSIVVSHTHTGTTSTTGNHTHYFVENGPYLSEQDNPENPANYLVGANASSSTMAATATLASQQYFSTTGNHSHTFTTGSSGSSGANANLQPYITVYMWKRTA